MQHLYKDSAFLLEARSGPFGAYLDVFAEQMLKEGYAASTAHFHIRCVRGFGAWLSKCGLKASKITLEYVHKYLRYRDRKGFAHCDLSAFRRLLAILSVAGKLGEEAVPPTAPAAELAATYRRFLQTERALSKATIDVYNGTATNFLNVNFGRGPVDLASLSAAHVIDFVRQEASRKPRSIRCVTNGLRSFFRYALYAGIIDRDLAASVPPVAYYALSSIPKSISAEQVQQVLRSCDLGTSIGRRDYSILLLLARLGLRASEVVSLTLSDIDWENGLITVRGKTGYRPRLPLSDDVGKALATYLRDGRPPTNSRKVFLRDRAPNRGFAGPAAISTIVMKAIDRANISTRRKGAHLFRHSLACQMLQGGASLGEIGEVLGHRSPDTTAIYAKVNVEALRQIALPWPGGAL